MKNVEFTKLPESIGMIICEDTIYINQDHQDQIIEEVSNELHAPQ